jgi:hypothetical protein
VTRYVISCLTRDTNATLPQRNQRIGDAPGMRW